MKPPGGCAGAKPVSTATASRGVIRQGDYTITKLLWFRQDRDETAIMDTLAALAAQHGYINQRGPKYGAGNVAELMAAIATGEVKLLLLPDEQQTLAAEFLRQSAADCAANVPLADALTAIADSLQLSLL